MRKPSGLRTSDNAVKKTVATKSGFASKVAISAFASVILAFLIKLTDFDSYAGFISFFTLDNLKDIGILLVILLVIGVMLAGYTLQAMRIFKNSEKILILIFSVLILTYILCILFGVFISIYVVPMMLSALLISALVNKRVGLIANILMNQVFFLSFLVFSEYKLGIDAVAALVPSTMAGIAMIIVMDRAKTRLRFIVYGIAIGIISSVLTLMINLISTDAQIEDVLLLMLWSGLSSILSVGLFMLILPFLEYIFRQNTIFRLAEYSSLDTPLLKRLAKEAPGTFNHSLVVGNLAELCALAIGENAQLAKAASYYHDVGKLNNPDFFIENQKGYNPHDDLIPEVSVKMITEHTKKGYNLIKKAHLPDIIAEVALEHHGTTPVGYFLYKAQKLTEDDIDREDFSYNDPIPSNKISAIVMIVDTVEAATRANLKTIDNAKELRAFIHKLIKDKADLNLFNNCELTFMDLQIIEDTLVEAVPSLYHSRIAYGK